MVRLYPQHYDLRNDMKTKTDLIIEKLIGLYIVYLFLFSNVSVISYISNVILMFLVFICFANRIAKDGLKINAIEFWVIIFAVYSFFLKECLSGGWSRLLGVNIQTAISILICTCVFFAIESYADCKAKRESLLKMISGAGLILAIYTVIIVRGNIFLGLHSAGMTEYLAKYGLQSNEMGFCFGIAFLASFFLWKKYPKYHYCFAICINALFVLLCGSRKALIYLVVGLGVYFIFTSKKSIVQRIILAGGIGIILFYCIMNIPLLYRLIGHRFASLLDIFNGGRGTDSTYTRFLMIEYGMRMIKENPWFGSGFNSFYQSYGTWSGNYKYAHNNYIELLVSGGIVFTIIYYLRYVLLLKKYIYNYVSNRDNLEIVIYAAMAISMLIADIATVSYYYQIYYLVFAVICSWVRNKQN